MSDNYSVPQEQYAARMAAIGVNESRILAWLDQIAEHCPVSCGERNDLLVFELTKLLCEMGSEQTLRHRWKSRFHVADFAQCIHERLADEVREGCSPPTEAEVGRVKNLLSGYQKLRMVHGELVAADLQEHELADLSYFLAAVREADIEVGRNPYDQVILTRDESVTIPDLQSDRQDPQLRRNPSAFIKQALQYLARFGYPKAMLIPRKPKERDNHHDSKPMQVMRDLAWAYELTGQYANAAVMYRRALPQRFHGCTGTSTSIKEQSDGALRTAALAGNCRAAIPERLAKGGKAVLQLSNAGFDVARLYRGALVTVNRNAASEPGPFKNPEFNQQRYGRIIQHVRMNLPSTWLDSRLAVNANVDWERRLSAIEGLAAAGDEQSVMTLADLALAAIPSVRIRALHALQDMMLFFPSRWEMPEGRRGVADSRDFEKMVSAFDNAKPIDPHTPQGQKLREQLARAMLPLLSDPDADVQRNVAVLLADIGSALALSDLVKLLQRKAIAMQTCELQNAVAPQPREYGPVDYCWTPRRELQTAKYAIWAIMFGQFTQAKVIEHFEAAMSNDRQEVMVVKWQFLSNDNCFLGCDFDAKNSQYQIANVPATQLPFDARTIQFGPAHTGLTWPGAFFNLRSSGYSLIGEPTASKRGALDFSNSYQIYKLTVTGQKVLVPTEPGVDQFVPSPDGKFIALLVKRPELATSRVVVLRADTLATVVTFPESPSYWGPGGFNWLDNDRIALALDAHHIDVLHVNTRRRSQTSPGKLPKDWNQSRSQYLSDGNFLLADNGLPQYDSGSQIRIVHHPDWLDSAR